MSEQATESRFKMPNFTSDDQTALLREYLLHHINAPCWRINPWDLQCLKDRAAAISSRDDVILWLNHAADWGLDPF
jgi:hypothetical protein